MLSYRKILEYEKRFIQPKLLHSIHIEAFNSHVPLELRTSMISMICCCDLQYNFDFVIWSIYVHIDFSKIFRKQIRKFNNKQIMLKSLFED